MTLAWGQQTSNWVCDVIYLKGMLVDLPCGDVNKLSHYAVFALRGRQTLY